MNKLQGRNKALSDIGLNIDDHTHIVDIPISELNTGLQNRIKIMGLDNLNKLLVQRGVIVRKNTQSKKKEWTLEMCLASAAPFDHIKPWQVADPSAYQAALRQQHKGNGWVDKCRAHMRKGRQRVTNEELKESASKYPSMGEWKLGDPVMHKAYWNMRQRKNILNRITITFEIKKTALDILKDKLVERQYKTWQEWRAAAPKEWKAAMSKKGNLDIIFCEVFLTSREEVNKIRREENRNKKINKCFESASVHKTVGEWRKVDNLSYTNARYNFKVLDAIISRFGLIDDRIIIPTRMTSIEECVTVSKTCRIFNELRRKNPDIWRAVKKMKTSDPENYKRCTGHFDVGNKRLTEEMFLDGARKFKTVQDFLKTNRGKKAKARGYLPRILAEVFPGQKIKVTTKVFWTKETASQKARTFPSKNAWLKNCPASYQWLRKHHKSLWQEISSSMEQSFRWTDEKLIEDAKKYPDRFAWGRNSNSATTVARRRGVYNFCSETVWNQPISQAA